MNRIEAVVRRSELKHFFRCAEKLGIFGFDLSENGKSSQSLPDRDNRNNSSLKVDFVINDADTNRTIHAVLEQAHPDSIAIFKLGPETNSTAETGRLV